MRTGRQNKTVLHFLWDKLRVLISLQVTANNQWSFGWIIISFLLNDLAFSNNANNGFEIQTVITYNMV